MKVGSIYSVAVFVMVGRGLRTQTSSPPLVDGGMCMNLEVVVDGVVLEGSHARHIV